MTKEFIVTTDASDFALGAVLGQGKIGEDKACNYGSRFLRGAEYSTYDRELLAIVFAKDLFRPFLYGRIFTIITDHEPLKHFHKTKKPDLRFNRLKADLCGYEFDIIYRPRPRNCNADALSRNPRIQLYELATKQEEYDNYNEHGPPTKILHVTRTKRNRLQAKEDPTGTAGGPASSSEDSLNTRAKKFPHIESSIGPRF